MVWCGFCGVLYLVYTPEQTLCLNTVYLYVSSTFDLHATFDRYESYLQI